MSMTGISMLFSSLLVFCLISLLWFYFFGLYLEALGTETRRATEAIIWNLLPGEIRCGSSEQVFENFGSSSFIWQSVGGASSFWRVSVMLTKFAVLLFWVPAAAQKLTAFDAASASSVYSTKSFGADLATLESSGRSCWCAQCCKSHVLVHFCLVPGIGAALGPETWERQVL